MTGTHCAEHLLIGPPGSAYALGNSEGRPDVSVLAGSVLSIKTS